MGLELAFRLICERQKSATICAEARGLCKQHCQAKLTKLVKVIGRSPIDTGTHDPPAQRDSPPMQLLCSKRAMAFARCHADLLLVLRDWSCIKQ